MVSHAALGLRASAVWIAPLLALALPAPAMARPANAPLAALNRVFAADAGRESDLHPLDAVPGAQADPRALAQMFTDGLDAQLQVSAQASLTALARIDRAALPPAAQISYDVFAANKRSELALLAPEVLALTRPQPFNHFLGLHVTFPGLMAAGGGASYADAGDYRRALALDRAFVTVLAHAEARFRLGLDSHITEPGLTVRNMIAQIDAMLALGVEGSPFYSPVLHFPDAMPEPVRASQRRAYRALVRNAINPAYRHLRNFLASTYLPQARDSIGLAALPGGAKLYRRLIATETTLPLDPDAVHRLGLAEVARIETEMAGVKAQLGFAGPLPAFFDRLRADPAYHPRAASELADGFAAIGRAVDARIPAYFGAVPKARLLVAPYPAYRGRFEAGGGYDPPPGDGGPGVFRYNTFDLPSRFLTGMTTLYLHEGAPGHHFQISLAQENEALPDFQRTGGNTAFVEGWALYAETLGYPMGLYADPRQHWGTLDDEMLRAMRLVVDTGIHAQGWDRARAVDYMLGHSGIGRSDAEAEVDRYIASPAQALAYKVGALTIQRLRARAEAALGPKFDIKAFHEQVLGSGALPLPVLEAKVERWIADQH